MTDPVEAIVACPVCRAMPPVNLGSSKHPGEAKLFRCERCNGTGLVRIRALREDVPTIDRVPKDAEYLEPRQPDNMFRDLHGRTIKEAMDAAEDRVPKEET